MRKQLLALAAATTAALSAVGIANAESPPPVQVSGQSATTSQQAGAASSATQINPSNTNISIRVLSPGSDGNVTQSNSAASSATAGNAAGTLQAADQNQGGGGGIQTSQQQAGTSQLAAALSAAKQVEPSNTNVGIRVLSPGSDGNVSQSNSAASSASAGNKALTGQAADQTQGGSSCECGGGSGGIQTAKQDAATGQAAGALSSAEQVKPSNENVSVRVLSPGGNGDVTQSNSAASSATAGNAAGTLQHATQTQDGTSGCGCDGTAVQDAKQSAATGQLAGALSAAKQYEPSNESSPTSVDSAKGGDKGHDGCGCDGKSHDGYGGDAKSHGGDVTQSNSAASSADAGNLALTGQGASQNASGNAIQIAGQDAATLQGALAGSTAVQKGASNEASPVRVKSPGGGGDVTQSNSAASSATAGNHAGTLQHGSQSDGGRSCECDGKGLGIQVLGQKSNTEQGSAALSSAVQWFHPSECGCGGPSGNVASPTRVGSPGHDGDVTQSNSAASSANAGNKAFTGQSGDQQIAGGGGLAIQALGQEASTVQKAFAGSSAFQFGASNEASPTRVYSPGGGGDVTQSNSAASSGSAGNHSGTIQYGRQAAADGCGCHRLPIQVLGQSAGTGQLAWGASQALQFAPSNVASPTSVWSPSWSKGGDATQANSSASRGDSGNLAGTGQFAGQTG